MNKKVLSIVAIIALIAVMTVCLVACNASTYEKKLKEAGYTVAVAEEEDIEECCAMLDVEESQIKWIVYGNKNLISNVFVIKFNKISDAKEAVENFNNKQFTKLTIERTSSYVFFGTSDAVDVVK